MFYEGGGWWEGEISKHIDYGVFFCFEGVWKKKKIANLTQINGCFIFRPGHECKSACIVVALLQYDALDSGLSAQAYSSITSITNANIGKENFFSIVLIFYNCKALP